MSMLRSENVATPFTAATVFVPLSVPPPGFVPIAIVILAVLVVTTLLLASCTCTVRAGLIATPAVVFVGCCENASLVAAPGVISKALLVAPVSPAEEVVNV